MTAGAPAAGTPRDAQGWIDALGLVPLPEEGGWYREVYRAAESIPQAGLPARFPGPRRFATSIYYLLHSGEFSAFHRIRQDEGWHFYTGSPLVVHTLAPEGAYGQLRLGPDFGAGERFQATVPAGTLFAAEVAEAGTFALAGCTVAPGFEFQDFEVPGRAALLARYPAHGAIIRRLTR